MATYRSKLKFIEAIQWNGTTRDDWPEWLRWRLASGDVSVHGPRLAIATLEGTMFANDGDWIIKGIADEVYPCKPAIFEASYELAPWPSPDV